MDKYYLRIENDNFGFVVNGMHTILDTDIEISQEDYNKFFELQGQGKQFRLKENVGTTLFDIVEEYVPPVDTTPQAPTLENRVQAIEDLMLTML